MMTLPPKMVDLAPNVSIIDHIQAVGTVVATLISAIALVFSIYAINIQIKR
jgi:hypothetical protein